MGHTFCSPPDPCLSSSNDATAAQTAPTLTCSGSSPPAPPPPQNAPAAAAATTTTKRKARISGYVQSKPPGPAAQQAQARGSGEKKTLTSSNQDFEDFVRRKKSAAVEEYWDSEQVNRVCDLVRETPPKEVAGSSPQRRRRRKRILERLSLTPTTTAATATAAGGGGSLSSSTHRHLKQMLLLRRSSSSSAAATAVRHDALKDAVALQTTSDGKTFFKIAANSAMGSYGRGDPAQFYGQGYAPVEVGHGETFRGGGDGGGNPSVYRVNECREVIAQVSTDGKENDEQRRKLGRTENSGEEQSRLEVPAESRRPLLPPISSLDNNELDYFDIAEEYLRHSAEHDDQTGAQDTIQSGVASAQRPNALAPYDRTARNPSSVSFPRHDSNSKATVRQRDSRRTFIPLGPSPRKRQTHRSPIRAMKHSSTTSSKALSPSATATSPRSLQNRSQPYPPKTPRSSSEEAKRSTLSSPKLYSRPQASPVHSNSESVAEDGQSEASVGMAQSVEVVRPCFYSASSHKFPRPGPAPTGALPSLPEGHDSKTSIVLLPSVDAETARATQSPRQSPARFPARSLAKDHRYKPSESELNDNAGQLVKTRPKSQAKQQISQSHPAGQSETPNFERLHENGSPAQIHTQPQALSRQDWREERARSRKELKMRHLDRLRAQHDSRGAVDSPVTAWAPVDAIGHDTQESKMRQSYSSPALLASRQPEVDKTPEQAATVDHDSARPTSALSPILVVAEQAPTSIVQFPPQSSKDDLKAKRTRKKHHTQKSTYSSTTAASPDRDSLPLPSSDDETAYRSRSNGTLRGSSARRSHAQTSSTHRSSAVPLQELESRISDLEKKNAMLLNALIAVINTSAGFSARCDRSSMFSEQTTSRASGQRSSGQTSSGQSGHRNGGTDVVGGKCATESVLMQGGGAGRA
ncbi:MAG: hypothetical protein Q9191_006602 [Dirinaria sp. TL-2023a]